MDDEIDFRTLIFGGEHEEIKTDQPKVDEEPKKPKRQRASSKKGSVKGSKKASKKRGRRVKGEDADKEEDDDVKNQEDKNETEFGEAIERANKRAKILYENAAKAQNLTHVPTEPIPPNFLQMQQAALEEPKAKIIPKPRRNENIARLHPADAKWQSRRRKNTRNLQYELKGETRDVGRSISEAIDAYKLDQVPLREPKIPSGVLKANAEARALEARMQVKKEEIIMNKDAQEAEAANSSDDEFDELLTRFKKNDTKQEQEMDLENDLVYWRKQGMYEIDTDYSWLDEGRLMPYQYEFVLKEYEHRIARSIDQQREATDHSDEESLQEDSPRLQIKSSINGTGKGSELQNEYHQRKFLSHFPWAQSVHESQGYGSHPEIVQHRNLIRLSARFVIAGNLSSKSGSFNSRQVPMALILNILTRKQLYEERDLIATQGKLEFLRYCKWLVERGKGNSSARTLNKLGLTVDRQGYVPTHQIGKPFPTPRSMKHLASISRSVMEQLKGDKFLTSTFSLIPGGDPPIPPNPMDAPSFLLGPMEPGPHINQFPVIAESSQRLTAALLMEWSLSRRASERADAERKLIKTLIYNIKVATKAQDNIRKYLLRLRGHSYACYTTIALFADIMINSFAFRRMLESGEKGGKTVKKRLKQIYNCIDKEICKDLLTPFPRINAVHGQLRFSYVLPIPAIEFLRDGLNDTDRRTPFDLIRLTLEYMEANHLLTDELFDRASKAYVPELDFAFFSAAKSFTTAFNADPTDPQYLAWQLAALCACIILCSGNRIDSVARCHPSGRGMGQDISKLNPIQRAMLDKSSYKDCLPHEVREKLTKFEDLRKEIAMSFDLLCDFCRNQKSCLSHLYISSFLEWKQVIALVFGSKLTEDLGSSFVQLHSAHTTQWALKDQSAYAQSYLSRTKIRGEFIDDLALTLENDPENIDHWRRLVEHLGPISKTSTEPTLHPHDIRSDGAIPSVQSSHAEQANDSSIGKEDWKISRSYWINSLLASCTPRISPFEKEAALQIYRKMTRLLEDHEVDQPSTNLHENQNQDPFLDQRAWMELLFNSESGEEKNTFGMKKEGGIPDEDERIRVHDHMLPRTLTETLNEPEDTQKPPFSRLHLDDDENGERLEILCYKVFLLCHFGEEGHLAVSQILQYLIAACWNTDRKVVKQSIAEWRAIMWLHRRGVPVTCIFPEEPHPLHVPKPQPRAKKGPRKSTTLYPKAMCDAVKEGIRLFGFKQWVLIQATYPIFDGHHRRKAEKCYHFMVKTRLMDPHEEDDGKWRRWKKT